MNTELIQQQIKEYQNLQLHKRIGNRSGFFTFYFEQLKEFNTQVETFNHCNELYFELFGEYKYETLNSFRRSLNHYNNQH